ncbi:hypothetical protein BaRGS_00007521 [Batillaria attramentaria]|uniref:Uncharacterized protein n=1 Tax=Batillaria attramentaria TaxID=370345 RepID=A0ABD0LQ90_9CAEN
MITQTGHSLTYSELLCRWMRRAGVTSYADGFATVEVSSFILILQLGFLYRGPRPLNEHAGLQACILRSQDLPFPFSISWIFKSSVRPNVNSNRVVLELYLAKIYGRNLSPPTWFVVQLHG